MENIDQKREKLHEYASLKLQISALEDQIDMIKPEVELIVLELNPADKAVEIDEGRFEMVPKRKYTYTDAVKIVEDNLKEMKKTQEANGHATYVEEPYLKFLKAKIS